MHTQTYICILLYIYKCVHAKCQVDLSKSKKNVEGEASLSHEFSDLGGGHLRRVEIS